LVLIQLIVNIDNFLREKNIEPGKDFIVAMAPGAGTKIKQWPAERFAKVADHIYKKYNIPIFILGGPGDREEFKKMGNNLKKGTRIISCLNHTIDELKAFISNADLVIANDSAPIYVAEAFNRATITIVGPTDENEHPPKGEYHHTVKRQNGDTAVLVYAGSSNYTYSKEKAREQIESISVEKVTDAIDELISKIKG